MVVDGIVVNVIEARGNRQVSILKVKGYLDTTTAGELEGALASLLNKGKYKIVVDLSNVNYISSAGWGIFIGEIKKIRENAGDLKLAGMIADVFEVFQLLEFHSILESYPTTEEAVASFGEGKPGEDREQEDSLA